MEKPPFSQNLPHPPHRIARFSAKNACWWIFLLSPLLCLQNRPSAQETLNLPFSLQCVLAPSQYGLPPSFLNPALLSIHAQEGNPQYFIGSSAQMGFIKENGLYSLSSGIRYKKDAWNIHYLYKGFPALNRQAAGLGYARNFLAGFSAGISATYQSTSKIEDLVHELKKDYTIVIVTHNMQQAARVSDKTGYFYLGELIEYGETRKIFTNPEKESTQNYITGRFG